MPDLRLGEGPGDPRPRRNTRARSIVALITALLAAPAAAQITLPIDAAADNTIYSDVVTFSNGAGERVFAGRTNQTPAGIRRALMRFDVASAVPPGSTVTSVKLTLSMSAANATSPTGSYALHRVTAPWGEGNSNAVSGEGQGVAAQVNDATWLYRFFNPANPLASPAWAAAGGDFVPAASASIQIPLTLNYYSWNSTPGLVADVQTWLDTPATNNGWIIVGPEGQAQTARRFDSRQNSDPQRRPRLEVTFTLAPGVGACCFTDGSCQVVTQPQCQSQGGTFSGVGTICTPNPCPQPTAACCLPSGNCLLLTPPECAAMGGVFQGVGSTCTPNPCSPQIGGCCLPTGFCQILTQPDCVTAGGTFLGVASTCGGANCPIVLVPFVDEITKPAVAQPATGTSGGAAHYNISATEFKQKLHRDLPQTLLWGYSGTYPGPTIEAFRDAQVTVSWINNLRVLATQLLRATHYLPVDLCLHGPNMFGSVPRLVTHLHGARVKPESDGYPEATVNPGQTHQLYTYPNGQLPATMWYHDHALGLTRLNVYMGLAAFYLIRDAFENGLALPTGDYEMPLLIQDKSFNPDGTLKYAAVWQEDFFGEFMLVNGKVWPFMNVKRGKYRFRLVNGCTSRVLALALSDGATFHIIGNDLGMLPAPVPVTSITLAPAERVDLVINFATYTAGAEVTLVNSAPAPFPGQPGVGVVPNVMKFNVGSATGFTTPLPASLRPNAALPESSASVTREFSLSRVQDACTGIRWAISEHMWDEVLDFPRLETSEIWSFVNKADMTHSLHIHLVSFKVLDRQPFQLIGGQVVPTGPRVPPPPEEAGWKDTVRVQPQEITRVISRFEGWTGLYPYHCHMLEHEDHEMMRQFRAVCYHDCNEDQQYTVADFGCFQTKFVTANPYADCNNDGSLTVADFGCFQTKFVTGCP